MRKLFRRHVVVEEDSESADQKWTASSTSQKQVSPVGIHILYSPEEAIVDIVFIHGLTGDCAKTWTAPGACEPWPKVLLPAKIPNARVLTFGYDASVVKWRQVVSESRMVDHAGALLTSLALFREEDDTSRRPIIFVCHGLGGLLCEDALVLSRQRLEPHLRSILECTRGVAFLGTPHHGVSFAKWIELFSRSLGLIRRTNVELVKVLRPESEVLARIQLSFDTAARSRAAVGEPIEITCFYEMLPLAGLGLVVPQHSATLVGYNAPIGIRANHFDMTRFSSVDDPGFVAVYRELGRWVRGIAKAGAAQPKQDWVSVQVKPVPLERMLEDAQLTPVIALPARGLPPQSQPCWAFQRPRRADSGQH